MYNLQIVEHRIMEIATTNHLSKNQLLKNAGLNKSLFDNMKKGQIPSIEKIHKIANYLDCSVDYLLGRTQNPMSHKNIANTSMEDVSDKGNTIAQKYNTLDEYGKRAVNALIEAEYIRCTEMSHSNGDIEYVYKVARAANKAEETPGGMVAISKDTLDLLDTAPESDVE